MFRLLINAQRLGPAYRALENFGTAFIHTNNQLYLLAITLVLIVLSLALSLVVGPQTAFLAELFPAKNRNSAATLPHNLAAGWIGGMLPLIVTWLNQAWGNSLAGLWYPTIFLICASTIAIFALPETNKRDLIEMVDDEDN